MLKYSLKITIKNDDTWNFEFYDDFKNFDVVEQQMLARNLAEHIDRAIIHNKIRREKIITKQEEE